MTPDMRRVLEAVSAEQGELTLSLLPGVVGLPKGRAQKAVYALRRKGYLEPRVYRALRHKPTTTPPMWAPPLAFDIWAVLLKHGPLSREALAMHLGKGAIAGDIKRAVNAMRETCLSVPAELWASESGVLALREAA